MQKKKKKNILLLKMHGSGVSWGDCFHSHTKHKPSRREVEMEQIMTSGGCENVFRFNLNTVSLVPCNQALVIRDNVACFSLVIRKYIIYDASEPII